MIQPSAVLRASSVSEAVSFRRARPMPWAKARKIEFAWNAQKNQMSDIKGKEREQEREGQIKNDMIDLDRTHLNYDLVHK